MSHGALAILGGAPLLSELELRTWPRLGGDEVVAVVQVLDRGILAGDDAPVTRRLEERFAELVGARHALLTHAGTSALHLALIAAKTGSGDEVVLPAYGYIAGPMCVLALGAIPRFVDVDRETGNLDPSSIDDVVNERTRAIMPMHIHGCPADMDEILETAARHGLVVVEDAAQAHGTTYRGRSVGTLGAMAAFSLHESKALPAGEGGLFVTDDDAMMETALRARSLGRDLRLHEREGKPGLRVPSAPLLSVIPGHMFRGNEMMAALALSQLPRLAARISTVQKMAELLGAELDGLPGLRVQRVPADRTASWYKVRLHFDVEEAGIELPPCLFRDLFVRALEAEGVEAGSWQHVLLPGHPVFADVGGFGQRWRDRSPSDPVALRDAARARFPNANALLESSVVLFSERRPLMAQPADTVRRVAAVVRKVWTHRHALQRLV
ncbi:MAG: DegT/DnrJ/EryC1/StrS family aminotransferase [Sandaracinaceae bacterium]|nr:DegT/DnrJ/EryC1/StrS family aminotransferase [Sandaracinaceae bacterium]